MDLAPLRRALIRPRRLSDRDFINDLDFASDSPSDEAVNTAPVVHNKDKNSGQRYR